MNNLQNCNDVEVCANYLYIGGGTAGHIYPAQALAEQAPKNSNHILLTDERGQKFNQFFNQVYVSPVSRRHFLRTLLVTFVHSWTLLRRYKFDAVFVCGGYVCVIPALLAKIRGLKVVVIETNAILGRTNALISKLTKLRFSTFNIKPFIQVGFIARNSFSSPASRRSSDHQDGSVIEFSRCDKARTYPQLQTVSADKQASKLHSVDVKRDEKLTKILVLGSSIGTEFFCNVLPAAVKGKQVSITHQSPVSWHDQLKQEYGVIPATLSDYFINVYQLMLDADLIICRSGASTLAELACLNKACILVPWAKSCDNHQLFNAKAFKGVYIEEDQCTPEALSVLIEQPVKPEHNISTQGAQTIWDLI